MELDTHIVGTYDLMALFRGDDDTRPCLHEELIAAICDTLSPPPPGRLDVADAIFPCLRRLPAQEYEKYVSVLAAEWPGDYAENYAEEAMKAVDKGFTLWRERQKQPAKAA